MNEGEPPTLNTADDSLTVEVSDLRQPAEQSATRRHASQPAPFGARLQPRQRLARVMSATGAILLAAIVVGLLVRPRPFPSQPPAPASNQFYIVAGAPWATIALDGHPLARLPIISVDPPLTLARGSHRLVWRADPFQAIHCAISAPIAVGDTCPYDHVMTQRGGYSAWVITFFPSLALLPDDQRAALLRVTQATLDAATSSARVRPGEWYAHLSANRLEERATQPLRATLRFTLATDPAMAQSCQFSYTEQCRFLGQDCLAFCTVPEQGAPAHWDVLAVVRPLWDFATLGGQLVAHDQPDGLALAGTGVLLRVTWERGAWRVALDFSNPPLAYLSEVYGDGPPGYEPSCAWIETAVRAEAIPQATDPRYAQLEWRFAPSAVRAAGCVGVATPPRFAGTPAASAPSLPPAYCLQRFGVLLAANDLAHQLWPALPVADADEQGLARQLAGQGAAPHDGGSP